MLTPHDWLPLNLPAVVSIGDAAGFGVVDAEAALRRRGDMQLELVVKGRGSGPSQDGVVAGERAAGLDVALCHQHTIEIQAHRVVPMGWSTSYQSDTREPSGLAPITEVRAYVPHLEVKVRDGAPAYLIEWVAGFPQWPHWTRGSRRKATTVVIVGEGAEAFEAGRSSEESFGPTQLEVALSLPNLQRLRIGTVSSKDLEGEPEIPNPGFIRYECGPDGLPGESLRWSLREALSFLFGTRMALLGHSTFDKEHNLLGYELLSCTGTPGRDEHRPAILIDRPGYRQSVSEQVVETFLRGYLAAKEHTDVDRAAWLLRHALAASVDMVSGYAGAALEVLRKGYYSIPQNEEDARLLPRPAWKPVGKALRDALLAQGSSVPDPVMLVLSDKLGNLNSKSGTVLNQQFLAALGLPVREAEQVALASRNDAAHGNRAEVEDWPHVLCAGQALWTLAARALCIVCGLRVPYIDYGSSAADEFPVRAWNEPQSLRSRRKQDTPA